MFSNVLCRCYNNTHEPPRFWHYIAMHKMCINQPCVWLYMCAALDTSLWSLVTLLRCLQRTKDAVVTCPKQVTACVWQNWGVTHVTFIAMAWRPRKQAGEMEWVAAGKKYKITASLARPSLLYIHLSLILLPHLPGGLGELQTHPFSMVCPFLLMSFLSVTGHSGN